jgi:NADH:ubiquinone oxidoreductase subunit 4 (subunit M)
MNLTAGFSDISKREFYILFYPFSLIILLGLFPNIILSKLEVISAFYLSKILN